MRNLSSRRKLMLRVAAATLMFLAVLPQRGMVAQTGTSCPGITFLGDYPRNETLLWSENTQGVAHDDGHWFITQSERLWKIPVEVDLNGDFFHPPTPFAPPPPPLPPGVQHIGVPPVLHDMGYNHMGDLDQVGGFLFIPLEGGEDVQTAIGVFRAFDLSYVGLKGINQEKCGWIAFNPTTGLLYSSEETIESDRPLYRYELKLDVLANTGNVEASIVFKDYSYLFESDGSPLFPRIGRYTQGGAFTPWGDFLLCAGRYLPEEGDRRMGIFVFDRQGRLITDSYNTHDVCLPRPYPELYDCQTDTEGTFEFAFEPDADTYEEPEGLDWWDRDSGPASPGIHGQLHVLLVDQDVFTQDDIYFKHYLVDTSCCTITCPSNVVVANTPGQCGTVVNYDAPTATCATPVCTPASGTIFNVGTTVVNCAIGTGQRCTFLVTVTDAEAPAVNSSVARPSLWPPTHELLSVGLAASVSNNCSDRYTTEVLVFSDEDDETSTGEGSFSPDAKDLAVGTLRLRSERSGSGDGRVYIIVVKATDSSSNVGFSVNTVVVPKSQAAADINSANAQAAAARAYSLSHNGAPPPGYSVIGDGPSSPS